MAQCQAARCGHGHPLSQGDDGNQRRFLHRRPHSPVFSAYQLQVSGLEVADVPFRARGRQGTFLQWQEALAATSSTMNSIGFASALAQVRERGECLVSTRAHGPCRFGVEEPWSEDARS